MKPLILGHRGASAYAPENTLAAFRLALEMGADGIELDVTLTRDGIPVIIHDDDVDRTTDGHGPIQQMTLAQVKQLDAGCRFEKFHGERIPTLQEVLEAVGKRYIVNIELKSESLGDKGLEKSVANVIDATCTQGGVIISSFNPFALRRMKRIKPGLAFGLLYAPDQPIYLRRAWLRPLAQPTALHPKYMMVTPQFVRWARGMSYKINTWTVDDADEVKRLADLGVDAIISNKPDIVRRAVG